MIDDGKDRKQSLLKVGRLREVICRSGAHVLRPSNVHCARLCSAMWHGVSRLQAVVQLQALEVLNKSYKTLKKG